MLDGDVAPADGEAITVRRRIMREGVVIIALDGDLNRLDGSACRWTRTTPNLSRKRRPTSW